MPLSLSEFPGPGAPNLSFPEAGRGEVALRHVRICTSWGARSAWDNLGVPVAQTGSSAKPSFLHRI